MLHRVKGNNFSSPSFQVLRLTARYGFIPPLEILLVDLFIFVDNVAFEMELLNEVS
jgi:hypothetical protein